MVQNTKSYRIIAHQYGISFASLQRHVKNGHISKELQEEYRTEGLIQRQELLKQLQDLQRVLYKSLRKVNSNNESETREVVMLTREIRAMIELLGKLLGRFPKEPEINILVNPVWLSLKQQIFQALGSYPEARQAVLLAVGEGDHLTPVQKKMIAGEPEHKPISPAVLAIIDREFEDNPEQHPELLPDEVWEKKKKEEQRQEGKPTGLLPTKRR